MLLTICFTMGRKVLKPLTLPSVDEDADILGSVVKHAEISSMSDISERLMFASSRSSLSCPYIRCRTEHLIVCGKLEAAS